MESGTIVKEMRNYALSGGWNFFLRDIRQPENCDTTVRGVVLMDYKRGVTLETTLLCQCFLPRAVLVR
jgi:hypothetical protein